MGILTRYHFMSATLLRGLRTHNRRVIEESVKKIESSTVLPLSEEELQALKIRDQKNSFPEFHFEPQVDPPTIDKTFEKEQQRHTEHEVVAEKKKKLSLKDFVLKIPLAEAPTVETVKEAVTPLYKMPYQKQLKLKQKHVESILRELRRSLKEVEAPITSTKDRLPCPLERIVPSPEILHYRNKDEFSVNIGVDGNPKTVGYYIGLPTDPNMRCIPPTHLVNIRESHKLVAQHFQSFIRASSYNTCLKFDEGGVWRNLVVRSNLKGDLMGVITVFSKGLQDTQKEEIKDDLQDYFFNGPGAECQLDSLFLQACPHSKCSREKAPFELIQGAHYLEEECMGKVFRISPDSFFQTNTKAAELLYHSIQKVAEISPMTTLLDICCGTGIISVLMSPHARGAIGIETMSGAIEDAKINAAKNNVRNVQYICGVAEQVLPPVTRELEDCSDVVAIVNPSRAGFNPSVIECIRQCEAIKKLIFVTCKPEGNALRNMTMLGATVKPNYLKWGRYSANIPRKEGNRICDPFSLRYAVPIDLFPHTLHVEYVFVFERMSGYGERADF